MTVSGTVESVGTFFPAKGVEPGLRLRLATKDGTVRVYAGPAGYARLEGFRFHYGDRIRVTGVEMKTDSGPTIQAGKIELDGKTLLLRSAEGAPLWTVPGRTPESGQGYRSKGEGS